MLSSRLVTLILPCYNEAEHIQKSLPRIIAYMKKFFYNDFSLIIIDDKSTDQTPQLVKQIIKKQKNITFLMHAHNRGRGATVTEGIRMSSSTIVGYIDIDLEVSPKYIPSFTHLIMENRADIVVAKRYYTVDFSFQNILRTLLSKGYAMMVRRLLHLPIHDTEAGYKFFKRQKILRVLSAVRDPHWFWDTELVARAYQSRLRIVELPVQFIRNVKKTSTVKPFHDSLRYIIAILQFRRREK